VKVEFVTAVVAEQEYTGGPVEICAVLNRMPRELLSGPDNRVIDEVDALMDELYRQRELTCPGHRWLSGPPPASIRDHLVHLHARGNIKRNAASGEWNWVDLTSYFAMPAKMAGPRVIHTDDRLFRYGQKRPNSGPT
jgi:hypothetical protein